MRAGWLSHRRCDRSGIDLPAVIVTGGAGSATGAASPARRVCHPGYARRLPLAYEAADEKARSKRETEGLPRVC
jgi:hypothetical protein